MALSSVTFTKYSGLITNVNYLDNNQVNPSLLLDCMNLQYTRTGILSARHGHKDWFVPVYNAEITNKLWGSFYFIPGQTFPHILALIGNNRSDLFQPTSDNGVNDTYTSRIVQYTGNVGATYLRTADTLETSDSTKFDLFPFSYYSKVHSWNTKSGKTYFNSSNGLFVNELSDTVNFAKHITPFIRSFTLTATTNSNDWLEPGYAVNFVSTVVVYASADTDAQFTEYTVSPVTTYNNLGARTNFTTTIRALIHNIKDLSNVYINVYRTQQYLIGTEPPQDFRLCLEIEASKGAVADDNVTLTAIPLELNDDALASQAQLYTNINEENILGQTVTVPASRDFCMYRDYGVYAGVVRPAYCTLNMTAIPASGDVITVNGLSKTFGTDITIAQNATAYTATNGQMTEAELSYVGNATNLVPLVIRPYDAMAASGYTRFCVPIYAKCDAIKATGGTSSNTKLVEVTPIAGKFDTTRFQAPGIFALVNSSGTVKDLVTYQDFEKIPNSGLIHFQECVSLQNFAAGVYDNSTDYFLFYLPGSSIENLPIYKIGDISATGDAGMSLLPPYDTYTVGSPYTVKEYFNIPVGTVGQAIIDSTVVKSKVRLSGILFKDSARLLDETVQNMVKTFNAGSGLTVTGLRTYVRFMYNGVFAQAVIVDSQAGYSCRSGSSTPAELSSIDVSGTTSLGANLTIFDTLLEATTRNLAEKTDIPNGIIFSKLGRPEAVSYRQVSSPVKIGNDNTPILRVVICNDQLYVFKTDGIYRIDIIPGGADPQIASRIEIDNTLEVIVPDAIQVVEESIFFLTTEGVCQLRGNTVRNVSEAIYKDLTERLSVFTNYMSTVSVVDTPTYYISSFKNDIRKQYGLTFNYAIGSIPPLAYVLDLQTMQWFKWDVVLNAAVVNSIGNLYSVYRDANNFSTLRRDFSSSALNFANDQYDLYLSLTGATITKPTATSVKLERVTNGKFGNLGALAIGLPGLTTDDRKLWYLRSGTYYPMTYSSTSGNYTIFTFDDAVPANFSAADDFIVLGVSAKVVPHRFFGGGPDTLSRFSKFVAQFEGDLTRLSVRFLVDTTNITFTGSYLSGNTVSETFITDIPHTCSRGRWIVYELKHSKPQESFNLLGNTWVASDIKTHRIKWIN